MELSRLPTSLPHALNFMVEQPIIWNIYAKIISGEYEGWYAQFVDDSEGETGGAYVLISQTMGEGGEAYDDWLEHASVSFP